MDDQPLCSSLVFQLTNDSAIYDVLEKIAAVYDEIFVYFLLYGGPVLVLLNIFGIFILTRKELRTSYNIVFIVMALNQALVILGRDILVWKRFLNFGCSFTYTLPWQLFEMVIMNFCPLSTAHVSWLAVIITFVRLRHIGSHVMEPSIRYMITACIASFVLILVISVPLFLSINIEWIVELTNCDDDEWVWQEGPSVVESPLLYEHDCLLLRITYLSSGVLFNALPCALLVILSLSLAFRLQKIYKSHEEMAVGRSSAANTDSKRSSTMIAMIVFTTLLTDVPQAVVNILIGFMSDRFRSSVAFGLSSLIVTLVMIASVCNLTIHLCMSRRFREVTKMYMFCTCRKFKSRKTTMRISSPITPKY